MYVNLRLIADNAKVLNFSNFTIVYPKILILYSINHFQAGITSMFQHHEVNSLPAVVGRR